MNTPYIYLPPGGPYNEGRRTWIGERIALTIDNDGISQLRLRGLFSDVRFRLCARLTVTPPTRWSEEEWEQYRRNALREAIATLSFPLLNGGWKDLHCALDENDREEARADFNSVEGREDLVDWLCGAYNCWLADGCPAATYAARVLLSAPQPLPQSKL